MTENEKAYTLTGLILNQPAVNLRVRSNAADLEGESIDVKTGVLESFGKAFLLPIDILQGWIWQRIFQ